MRFILPLIALAALVLPSVSAPEPRDRDVAREVERHINLARTDHCQQKRYGQKRIAQHKIGHHADKLPIPRDLHALGQQRGGQGGGGAPFE